MHKILFYAHDLSFMSRHLSSLKYIILATRGWAALVFTALEWAITSLTRVGYFGPLPPLDLSPLPNPL